MTGHRQFEEKPAGSGGLSPCLIAIFFALLLVSVVGDRA